MFAAVYQAVLDSAQSGGAVAGAMFWNAAIGGNSPDDGYNIYL
jgi:hypothetical protein